MCMHADPNCLQYRALKIDASMMVDLSHFLKADSVTAPYLKDHAAVPNQLTVQKVAE